MNQLKLTLRVSNHNAAASTVATTSNDPVQLLARTDELTVTLVTVNEPVRLIKSKSKQILYCTQVSK